VFLSIDLGTQSVRAILFDDTGQLIGTGHKPLPEPEAPSTGAAEWPAPLFWAAVVAAVDNLRKQGHHLDSVKSLALTCQRGTVVTLDARGEPLRPAISWLDQRQASPPPPIPRWLELGFSALGHKATLDYFRAQAEVNYLATHEPEIWEATRHFLLLSGYIHYRLTGLFRDSAANIVGYLPFDFRRHQWAPPGDWKWRALAISPDWLPEIVPVGAILGHLTDAAAEELGLPPSLPIVAAASDKACEALACGATSPSVGALSLGTTLTLNVVGSRYMETLPLLPPYPAAIPGHYSNELMVPRGFWMVRWFKEQFGHPEIEEAAARQTSPETCLAQLLRQTPAGNQGLILQPYWNPGIIQPGVEARGTMLGWTSGHTRAHLYRAIIEGLAMDIRHGLVRMRRRLGPVAQELVAAGGGSQSDEVLQIFADVLGQPVARPQTHEASGLGAAMVQAVAMGRYTTIREAAEAMVHLRTPVEPVPENRAIYDLMYKQAYRRLYGRLKFLYKRWPS
jgi:sugar (pentulose or hexulose) kinase